MLEYNLIETINFMIYIPNALQKHCNVGVYLPIATCGSYFLSDCL